MRGSRLRFRSQREEEFYSLLERIFPNTCIEHDHSIGHGLQIDFYINTPCKIAFEVDGAQHYGFNSMFHKVQDDFKQQQDRDAKKAEYCERNGIILIRIDARKDFDKDEIVRSIHEALDDIPDVKPKKTWRELANERNRAYRAKQYRLMKERRKVE